jgi:hypothetical protein
VYWCDVADDMILGQIEVELIRTLCPPLNTSLTLQEHRGETAAKGPVGAEGCARILAEFCSRRDGAYSLLCSDELWDSCNDHEDGDLICFWPFPGGAELVNFHDLWCVNDGHPFYGFRVPTPPAFAANRSGVVEPVPDYKEKFEERREWLRDIARQTDSWILAVVTYHGSFLPRRERKRLFAMLEKEKTLLEMYDES